MQLCTRIPYQSRIQGFSKFIGTFKPLVEVVLCFFLVLLSCEFHGEVGEVELFSLMYLYRRYSFAKSKNFKIVQDKLFKLCIRNIITDINRDIQLLYLEKLFKIGV